MYETFHEISEFSWTRICEMNLLVKHSSKKWENYAISRETNSVRFHEMIEISRFFVKTISIFEISVISKVSWAGKCREIQSTQCGNLIFSVIQILRETNLRESKSSKTAVIFHFRPSEVCWFGNFQPSKKAKFMKIVIQRLWMC